jgi:predicted nucleic acid-binding protein
MIVVADTSRLNYLVLLGYIEILPKIYGEVLIPQAVLDELQDSDAPVVVRAWVSTPPAWLRISSIVYQPNPLLDLLDRGERDAILLAESVKADRLIIDAERHKR